MSDEQIEVKPLQFTRRILLTIDAWPEHTSFTEAWLKSPHVYGATVSGDTVKIVTGNGEATYSVDRSRKHGGGYVATLVEGNDKANLKARRRKFEAQGE